MEIAFAITCWVNTSISLAFALGGSFFYEQKQNAKAFKVTTSIAIVSGLLAWWF